MILYFLEPEVAGGHGEWTTYESDKHPAKVRYLHYEFEGWLGDDLLESSPAFIASDQLKTALVKSELTGFLFEECLVTPSASFRERHPGRELPAFSRFLPHGKVEINGAGYKNWSGHSFCLSSKGELVVTGDALAFLKTFSLNHCFTTPLIPEVKA